MSLTNCRIAMILAKQPNLIKNGTFDVGSGGLEDWTSTTHGNNPAVLDLGVATDDDGNNYGLLYHGGTATYTQPLAYEISFDDISILWCVGVVIVAAEDATVDITITYSDDSSDTIILSVIGGRQLYSYGSSNWIDLVPYVKDKIGLKLKSISFHSTKQLWIDDLQMASFP